MKTNSYTNATPTVRVTMCVIKYIPRSSSSSSLLGFATVEAASGMTIHDVAIHQRDGTTWAQPPSKPRVGRDGVHMKKDNKGLWDPVVSFASKATRDRWSDAVIAALHAAHPEVLG
jgi:hypothetical protein